MCFVEVRREMWLHCRINNENWVVFGRIISHGHGRSGRDNESILFFIPGSKIILQKNNSRSHCKVFIWLSPPCKFNREHFLFFRFLLGFIPLPSIKRSWHLHTCSQTKCEIHLSPVWKRHIPLKMTISWLEPSHRCWQKVTPVTAHSCPKSQCVFHQFEKCHISLLSHKQCCVVSGRGTF